MQKKTSKTRVKMEVELSPFDYGLVCSGAAVHKLSPKEMIETLLEHTLLDWSNDDFVL